MRAAGAQGQPAAPHHGLVGAAPPLHHAAPRPALGARGQLGGEGREEGGLVCAAPPLGLLSFRQKILGWVLAKTQAVTSSKISVILVTSAKKLNSFRSPKKAQSTVNKKPQRQTILT